MEMTVKAIKMNGPQLGAAMLKASEDPVLKAAVLVQRAAQRSISKGATRIKGPRGGVHYIGSKPGDPPAVRTGELRASVLHALVNRAGGAAAPGKAVTAIIGPTKRSRSGYSIGKVLEFGTRNMAKRPFMRPALSTIRSAFPELFKGIMKGRVIR